jgi:quinol-cytochrome oxidoreductase complex cytochrome b subunit
MIIVLTPGATTEQAERVIEHLRGFGARARLIEGHDEPLIHIYEGPTRAARSVLRFDGVVGLVPTSGPRIRREGRRFYPYHFINWTSAVLLLLGVLVVLAGFLPPGGGREIDLDSGVGQLDLPWYLRAPQGFLALFPKGSSATAWSLLLLLALLVLFVPRIDRFLRRWIRGRWHLIAIGLLAVVAWLALSLKGVVL